ncbi:MAG TPA: MmgE/PrpD family protein [Xanthobacteraceae bacterium]|nr:MmgE/PrpD family protein [Xanthobacteraceae bacterium]
MAHETVRLAEYAAKLRYEDIPADVIERARNTIVDTVGTIVFGYDLPWSQMIVAQARRAGPGGKSRILGLGGPLVAAPAAAFANGALTHAFELDNLTSPGAGVHPGATLLAPGLAVAQERGFSGRDLLLAFVAGAEVMIRVGRATRHTNEQRGFHAPGTTGPFGGAIAVGKLYGFDAAKMTNALGIAGSLAGGLMEFARSGTGAMVKRLHLGRAAESGVLAAGLAADGFTGPVSVIEGEHGFLRVFCRDADDAELTRGLGEDDSNETWSTRTILMKRFACHISAHTSVQAILDLRAAHEFSGDDVAAIRIAGNEKMAKVNNIPRPKDVMMCQYSIPFSVALAHWRDPRDPRSYDESAFNDPAIRSLCERVTISVAGGHHDHATLRAEVAVELKDGRVLTRTVDDFKGTPQSPLDQAGLRERFMLLTRHCPPAAMERVFARLQNLEHETSLDWLAIEAAAKAA